ncbi:MAG TPA: PAC2 family protein [archaeon]|nr:PAC2 family protein [archaeon]
MNTKVKFLKDKKLKNAVLFTGLPGIGLVGKICVDYMLKQFKAEKVAEIVSDSFPPSVHTENGVVDLIKDGIFYFRFNDSDYLFLAGPVQPSLDMRFGAQEHYEFSSSILAALKSRGLKEICTLAGINVGDKRMQSEPKVIVASTEKKKLEEWKKLGAVIDRPVGLISGAAGLLLGLAKEEGIEASCLMGETNSRLVYGDPGAAKKILELLIKKYGFKIEMERMEKEAQEIEKAFSALTKQFENQQDDTPSGLSYVR